MKDNEKGFEEVIELQGEMNVVEEFLNVDSSLVEYEKNRDLIRMEMNIVEFPIFSKNSLVKINQIRKYYFSTDKQSYLEILPALNTQIPGEIEERVFIALTKILRNNNFRKVFYCTISDIFDNMKVDKKTTRKGMYPKIRSAISKMATTTFRFKNLFYSNEINRVVDDLIETNILTFRSITIKDANESEQNFFSDKRIKEVFKISVSDHFHDNIIQKGYLAFDADELLSIKDSVTRSIYTMITKWRFNKLYLKKPAYYIARRIPLAWDKNPRRTVLRIEESFVSLKDFGYISDYKLNRNDKWEKADFEIFFDESHNKIKRDNFLEEKQSFDKLVHAIEDRQNEIDVNSDKLFSDESFLSIYNTFPEVARRFKTLPNIIREALKKFDFKYVKYTAEYTALFCKASYIKYFKDALDKNWADEYIAKKEMKSEKQQVKAQEEKTANIEEAVFEEVPKITWEDFEKLDTSHKEKLESLAFEKFLKEAGSNRNDKTMAGIFEKTKKSLILQELKKFQEEIVIEPLEIEKEPKEDIKDNSKDNIEIKETFASVSSFMVKAVSYINSENIKVDIQAFMTVFTMLKEYEDEKIIIKYNEESKIGEIRKK